MFLINNIGLSAAFGLSVPTGALIVLPAFVCAMSSGVRIVMQPG